MSSSAGIGRKLALDALATALLQVVAKARSVLLLPILVHAGGDSLYGVWTMLAGLVALFIPLINLNAHQGLLRFAAPLDAPSARTLFGQVSAFSWAMGLVLAGCGAVVIVQYVDDLPAIVTGPVVIFTALQVPLWVAVRVNSAYLRARGSIVGAQISELAAQFIVTIAACVVFLVGYGLAEAQVSTAIFLLVEVVVVTVIITTSSESLQRASGARTATLGSVVAFSLPFIPGAISDWALFISDRYVIAAYHDEAMVGIYAGCYSLAQVLQMVSYPLEYAIAPVLPRMWDSGEHVEAARLLRNCFHLALAVLAPASTIMVLAGPIILSVLGSESMASEASSLLPLLCWAITVFACTRMIAHVALVAHHGRSVMIRVSVTAVLNVVLNIALVPSMGATGSAIATLACYLLYAVLIFQLVRPLAPELLDLTRPTKICVAALVPATIALLPLDSTMIRIAASVAYLAIYVAIAVLIRAITAEDARLLWRTLRRR